MSVVKLVFLCLFAIETFAVLNHVFQFVVQEIIFRFIHLMLARFDLCHYLFSCYNYFIDVSWSWWFLLVRQKTLYIQKVDWYILLSATFVQITYILLNVCLLKLPSETVGRETIRLCDGCWYYWHDARIYRIWVRVLHSTFFMSELGNGALVFREIQLCMSSVE